MLLTARMGQKDCPEEIAIQHFDSLVTLNGYAANANVAPVAMASKGNSALLKNCF
jgi:hypothetical protein